MLFGFTFEDRNSGHEDRTVREEAYIYSLAFFARKWNEGTIWTKQYILMKIEEDHITWPTTWNWRSFRFELEDLNARFLGEELVICKLCK